MRSSSYTPQLVLELVCQDMEHGLTSRVAGEQYMKGARKDSKPCR